MAWRFIYSIFLLLAASQIARSSSPSRQCKVTATDSDWPSAKAWKTLNDTLEGRLLRPVPPGAVCHPEQPTYDPKRCSKVAKAWSSYEFHSSDPISVMSSQFANDTCLPDASLPCSQKGYPEYVIDATTPEHVKLGINFARKNNLRLVVKSSGHDFLGRSTAPNSLSIWTHHMSTIKSHSNIFRPQSCRNKIRGSAITLGAGVEMQDAFMYLGALNQTMVGGSGRTVSVGGYATGGGFSLLSRRYGLAADNVVEMEIVTPTGQILTINECQNTDLFWAMRGGGGSTFGVITSITLKTFPSPRILAMDFMILADAKESFIYDMTGLILSQLPTLGQQGLSGYASIIARMPNPIPFPGAPEEVGGVIGVAVLQDTSVEEDMFKLWGPINDTINTKWPGKVQFLPRIVAHGSYLDYIETHYDNMTTGGDFYMASRLLDEVTLTGDLEALVKAIEIAVKATDGLTAFLVAGKGTQIDGRNAVNPGWRNSYIHAVISPSKQLDKAMEPFRQLSPNTGAYINEAFPFEKGWQRTFWGTNYPRLLAIKRKIDPDSVLWCQNCVGSEGWTDDGGRLCRRRS